MVQRQRGKLIVISGPSGAGKTSICRGLLDALPNARWSVSVTTRPKRGNEVEGVDYYYISREEFDRMVENGELLEHAEYLANGYGTPRRFVDDALDRGESVVMEIDVQGAAQVAERMPESIRVFVMPPDAESLANRLEGRRTETPEMREKRLERAQAEIDFALKSGVYPYIVTNDILQDSINETLAIIDKETNPA